VGKLKEVLLLLIDNLAHLVYFGSEFLVKLFIRQWIGLTGRAVRGGWGRMPLVPTRTEGGAKILKRIRTRTILLPEDKFPMSIVYVASLNELEDINSSVNIYPFFDTLVVRPVISQLIIDSFII
jgi:hypothetical protein